ncbi:unnamed protein product, partial [Rhizophagus irregularis]
NSQLPQAPHRRNSREGRTTPTNNNNQFSTPTNPYRKETYIPSIYDNNNNGCNDDNYNQENQGWDDAYQASSSLNTPHSSNYYQEEVTELDQDERLSQYGDNNNSYDTQSPSQKSTYGGIGGFLNPFSR